MVHGGGDSIEGSIHLHNVPGFDKNEGSQKGWNEGPQMGQSIGFCAKHNQSERAIFHSVLKSNALIDRNQYIEIPSHGVQSGAISKMDPVILKHVMHRVPGYIPFEPPRYAVVQQNSHWPCPMAVYSAASDLK